ncbi:MAG: diguanylate cyclase [Rhodopila sp.]
MKPINRFDPMYSIQTRLLAGFLTMLLLQIAVSASIWWWATNNADVAGVASAAAERSIAVAGTALNRLNDTQLRLADFLRTGDAVDRAALEVAISGFGDAITGAGIERGTQGSLGQAAPKIRSRLDAAVEAAIARREALANIVAIVTVYQNALVVISITGSQSPNRATADATAVAVTASFRPLAAISRYLVNGDASEEDNANAGLDDLRLDLQAILTSSADVSPRLQRLVHVALGDTARLNPALAEVHRTSDAGVESLVRLRGSVTQVTETLREYMQATTSEHDERSRAMQRARAGVRLSLVWSGALGFQLGGGIAVVIGLSITRPLGRLSSAMGRLAAGALDTTVPERARRDEVGRMAQAMEVFKENMNRNVELKATEDKLLTANAELEELARVDGLTELANRRCFDETLETEFLHCAREQLPLSLILIDVDRFKLYNDTYGHQAGDGCLRELSLAAKRWARRPLDLAARYGGEELAVLLPNADNEAAAVIAEQIRLAIRELRIEHIGSAGGVVTASLGVATIYPSGSLGSPTEVVKRADQCLYAAKAQGRDRVVSESVRTDMATGHRSVIAR